MSYTLIYQNNSDSLIYIVHDIQMVMGFGQNVPLTCPTEWTVALSRADTMPTLTDKQVKNNVLDPTCEEGLCKS